METNFEPRRRFANELDCRLQLAAWSSPRVGHEGSCTHEVRHTLPPADGVLEPARTLGTLAVVTKIDREA